MRCSVMFLPMWENLTSISFFGFSDRCQYLKGIAIEMFYSNLMEYFKDGFLRLEVCYSFLVLPDLTYITLNAQRVHPMLVKKTQAVTRMGLEPMTSCFLVQTS